MSGLHLIADELVDERGDDWITRSLDQWFDVLYRWLQVWS